MKKIGNIILTVMVALMWIYFFYRFPHIGSIAKILILIIYLPFTGKVIYSFLLERRQKKDAVKEDELAKNFTPFVTPDVTPITTANETNTNQIFCTECGASNLQGTKYCINCGKQLM